MMSGSEDVTLFAAATPAPRFSVKDWLLVATVAVASFAAGLAVATAQTRAGTSKETTLLTGPAARMVAPAPFTAVGAMRRQVTQAARPPSALAALPVAPMLPPVLEAPLALPQGLAGPTLRALGFLTVIAAGASAFVLAFQRLSGWSTDGASLDDPIDGEPAGCGGNCNCCARPGQPLYDGVPIPL